MIKNLLVIFTLTLLTGCLPEAPVKPVKIAMHASPENETLVIAEQLNYFPRRDVHIVEAPSDLNLMSALRSGAIDGAASSLASVLEWSAEGLDLSIVAVINGTNEYSFPERQVADGGSRLDSETYNVIVVRSDFLEEHPERIAQLVNGWQRVSREIEGNYSFKGLPEKYGIPEGDYNFTSYNENKGLLIVASAVSLHAVITHRTKAGDKIPEIDGRFFNKFAKDAGKAP